MKTVDKMIIFDMDGTIANLYGVENWLPMLRAEDPTPYAVAEPMYDMDDLRAVLKTLKLKGWRIAVTTWLAKDSTKEYDELVREAKQEWLDRYLFPYDELHMVKYGTTKANCTRGKAHFQILVDDNEKIRKGWSLGETIDANENVLKELLLLLDR